MAAKSVLDQIISLAKRRFAFQAGEIYGGSRSAWDYGPLGAELKENIKRQWWQSVVRGRETSSTGFLRHPAPPGLGSVRPRRRLLRPAGRVPLLPQALPCRPPRGRIRGEEGPSRRERPQGHRLRQLRHPRRMDRTPGILRPAQDLPRPGGQRRGPALPAPRNGPGHLRELLQRAHHSRKKPRSASARSASPSATRSRRATSSSAPASSSRWKWNSSSSPAPTSSGTSTG